MDAIIDNRKVHIYSKGFLFCGVCAPSDMLIPDMLRQVNLQNPTGLDHGWTVDDAGIFASGEPNPTECGNESGRLHYLLSC